MTNIEAYAIYIEHCRVQKVSTISALGSSSSSVKN